MALRAISHMVMYMHMHMHMWTTLHRVSRLRGCDLWPEASLSKVSGFTSSSLEAASLQVV